MFQATSTLLGCDSLCDHFIPDKGRAFKLDFVITRLELLHNPVSKDNYTATTNAVGKKVYNTRHIQNQVQILNHYNRYYVSSVNYSVHLMNVVLFVSVKSTFAHHTNP